MTPLLEARRVTKIFGGGLFERASVVAIENFSLAVDAERPLITAVMGARPGRSVHLRPAVHHERLVRHEVALGRAEVHRDPDDIGRNLSALDGAGLEPTLVLRLSRRVDLVHADREARRDGVDGGAVLPAAVSSRAPRRDSTAALLGLLRPIAPFEVLTSRSRPTTLREPKFRFR